MIQFSKLTENARIWVYISNRFITPEEQKTICSKGSTFLSTWAAHGADLKAALEIIDNCFLVIAVDEDNTSASGCSIDASITFLQSLEKDVNISFLDWQNIAYFDEQEVKLSNRKSFAAAIKENKISHQVEVFNANIKTKKDLDTQFKVRLAESNFKNLLPVKS